MLNGNNGSLLHGETKVDNKLQVLYDQVSGEYDLGSFDSFAEKMAKTDKREVFYNTLSKEYDLGAFEEFSNKIDPYVKRDVFDSIGHTINKNMQIVSDFFSSLGDNEKYNAHVQDELPPVGEGKKYAMDKNGRMHIIPANENIEGPGDINEVLKDPFSFEGAVGILKNMVFGSTFAQPPREGPVAEALDTPLLHIRKNMSEEAPVYFFPSFNTDSRQIMWSIAKGGATFLEGLSAPSNVILINSVGALSGPDKMMDSFLSAIFSADMASQMPGVAEDFTKAIEEGDRDKAIEVFTIGTLTTAGAAAAGNHALRKEQVLPKSSNQYLDRIAEALNDPEIAKKIISSEGKDVTDRANKIEKAIKTGKVFSRDEAVKAIQEGYLRESSKGGELLREQLAEDESIGQTLKDAEHIQKSEPIQDTELVKSAQGEDVTAQANAINKELAAREYVRQSLKGSELLKTQMELETGMAIRDRTPTKILSSALSETGKGILELLKGDPSILASGLPVFTEAGFNKAKPHFQAAWHEYKRLGRTYEEFQSDFIKKFGEEAKPYLERFRADIHAAGKLPQQEKDKDPAPYESEEMPEIPRTTLQESATAGIEKIQNERDAFKNRDRSFREKFVDILSVEAPFKRISAENTGKAVKNMYSVQETILSDALKTVKDIKNKVRTSNGGLTANATDMSNLALLAESEKLQRNMTPDQRALYQEPLRAIEVYFEKMRKGYEDRGADINFVERLRGEVERQYTKAIERDDGTAPMYKEMLDQVDDMKFVHIPIGLWMDKMIRTEPVKIGKVLSVLNARKRHTISIGQMISDGIIKQSDVNIIDIIGSYGRRAGKDFALLDIVNSAKKEGLAKSVNKNLTNLDPNFTIPPHTAPILRGNQIHPILLDWITELTGPNMGMNILSKGTSVVKMAQFINPLFLPMYNIIQGVMLGSFRRHAIGAGIGLVAGGIPGAAIGGILGEASAKFPIARGIYNAIKKTPRYMEAMYNGLGSVPYDNPWESFAQMLEDARYTKRGRVVDVLTDAPGLLSAKRLKRGENLQKVLTGLLPIEMGKDLYNLSWGVAWTLDRGIRMASYEWLRGKGMNASDAAQMAALYHGDYASVPAKTRRALNNLFFTPTFKIAMSKMYGNMLKGATDVAKGSKRQKSKLAAKSILYTSAIVYGYDQYMQSQGFERDTFGVSYKKRVDTDEGQKDLVITFSNPANLPLKYAGRIARTFRADAEKPIADLARTFKFEITPLARIAFNLANNKDDSGSIIYSPFDSKAGKTFKSLKYVMESAFRITSALSESDNNQEALNKLADETDIIFEAVIRPFTFTYLRDPKYVVEYRRLNSLVERYQELIRNGDITAEDGAKQVNEFLRQVDIIQERMLDDLVQDKK